MKQHCENILLVNGLIYVFNIICFQTIKICELPNFINLLLNSLLIIILIITGLFFKLTHTQDNVFVVFGYKVVNLYGILLFLMFCVPSFFTIYNFSFVEMLYMFFFSIIILSTIGIQKSSSK